MTKSKGFAGINIAAKWRRNYREKKSKEPWFLLTNLSQLSTAVSACQKRRGIEEMSPTQRLGKAHGRLPYVHRDWKKGGYNERGNSTQRKTITIFNSFKNFRLYCGRSKGLWVATLAGNLWQNKGIANYLGRVKEIKRQTRRPSRFYLGLHGRDW